MPQDEFDRLLERCSDRLAEISLTIPGLEDAAPRPTIYSLDPAPAPPKRAQAPPAPAAEPEPPPPPSPVRAAEPAALRSPEPVREPEPARLRVPEAASAPAEDEESEHDVFPPRRLPERTPPPRSRGGPPPVTPAFRRGTAAAVAGVLAAAAAYGLWRARRPAREIDLPVGDAEAMAVRPEKGDLLVAEGRELLDLTRGGETLSRSPLDSPVDSMSWNQGSLWLADGRASSVSERGPDGKTTVFSLNHVPGALYAKDRYLWTAERTEGALHQFLISRSILGAMLQPIDSFELRGLSPESFTIDDSGTLWVADGQTRRLYRLRLESGAYKRVDSAPLSPFVGPSGKLRDLTVDGDGVWILAEQGGGRVALRRIAVARLDWTPS
jgi:hypothetical protein